jgi:glycosyltransferase involved in cell wall biosynthesis
MSEDEDTVAIVQNPFWGCVIEEGDFSRVYYDCIDEISLFSGHATVSRFLKYESYLVNMCQAIFVTAEKLEDHIKSLNVDVPVIRVPNGVDYEWFQERVSTVRGLEDLKIIRRPIVGYVGVLRAWFDYALLGKMADALPDVSFVIVGPLDIQERIKDLRQYVNIHWLGRKEYDDVPLYINAFDACIIPFIHGKVSQTTNPVKIFEYFALGKPVVTSQLYELNPYTEKEIVYMADGDDQFLSLLRIALAERDDEKKRLREEIAREHSWGAQVNRMRAVILNGRK